MLPTLEEYLAICPERGQNGRILCAECGAGNLRTVLCGDGTWCTVCAICNTVLFVPSRIDSQKELK